MKTKTAGQAYQRNQIPGMSSSDVPTAADHADRHKEDPVGHQVGPGVHPDERLDLVHEGENGHEAKSHQKLSGQHQEDLRGGTALCLRYVVSISH